MTANLPNDDFGVSIPPSKSVQEKPAFLANLAWANVVTNTNESQQNAIANQQAVNQVMMSTMGRLVDQIISSPPGSPTNPALGLTPQSIEELIASWKSKLNDSQDRLGKAKEPGLGSTPFENIDELGVLRSLEESNRVFNSNLAQLNAISFDQAMSLIRLATSARCAEAILGIDPSAENASASLRHYSEILNLFEKTLR